MNATDFGPRCYVYDPSSEYSWGECCDELGIVPKPIWLVILLSLPIEAVVAASDIHATAVMYEKKSDRTALILIGYNLVSLGLIAYEFNWSSCEASAEGIFECYEGVLFMFYNSTAALASMTLWILIILRKLYPYFYSATRFVVFPNVFWRVFDKSNFPLRGTKEVVRVWYIISRSTGLFWYNVVGFIVTFFFGGGSHVIPMFFSYAYIFLVLWFALIYSHSLRIGYTTQVGSTTIKATLVAICFFYPTAFVVCLTFVALLPLNTVLALFTKRSYGLEVPPHEKDESGEMQLVIEESERMKFTVEVNAEDSLYDLKLAVIEGLGRAQLEPTDVSLTFHEELLLKDSLKLREYKIESGSSLQLFAKSTIEEADPLLDKLCERLRACMDKVSECCQALRSDCCDCLDWTYGMCCCCCCSMYVKEKKLIEEGALYKRDTSTSYDDARIREVGAQLLAARAAVLRARAQDPERRGEVEDGLRRAVEDELRRDEVKDGLADKEPPKETISQKRKAAINYVRDALRNLCLFDANGKVILFASATTFVSFTIAANYGILLYTGAPYLKAPLIDFYARRTELWFECTVANFADFNAFGVLDFIGLAVGIVAGIIQFLEFLSTFAS